jgi:hypothetical protein
MRMITEILDEEDDLTITEITARVQDRIGYGQSFDTLRRSVFRAVMRLHERDLVFAYQDELPTNDLGGYTYGYRVARMTYQREGRPRPQGKPLSEMIADAQRKLDAEGE